VLHKLERLCALVNYNSSSDLHRYVLEVKQTERGVCACRVLNASTSHYEDRFDELVAH
jgi:hypothetical protein